MLECGAARENIDPELPVNLWGYRIDLVSSKIHDSLHVAVVYLKNGSERLALLTYDCIYLQKPMIDEIRSRCAHATGLPQQAILTTLSHSHSTPMPLAAGMASPFSKEMTAKLQKYFEHIVNASVKALQSAIAAAEPARISYNTTHVRENLNRRTFFPSGQYFYQPKQKNLLPLCDGIADDELGVVYIKSAREEKFIATLVNYTAHPLTVGDSSTQVSADYPGVMKREIEANLGGVALFINGACGDNHPLGAEAGLGRCERMGQALAEKALYHRWDAVSLDRTPLASAYEDIVLPVLTDEQFKQIPQNFEHAYKPYDRTRLVDGGIRTSISLWAIGPLVFMGVPGETTAELGMRLKWESPFPKTFVMFIATDFLGYIPHRNAYSWGGYEVLTSRLAPAAGSVLCQKILESAEKLKTRMEQMDGGAPLHLPGACEGLAPGNAPGSVARKSS